MAKINYGVLKTKKDQNISNFPEIMRKLYGENLSLGAENTEGYSFGNLNFFIDPENGKVGVRIFGDEEAKRNLITKLKKTTGFALEEIN